MPYDLRVGDLTARRTQQAASREQVAASAAKRFCRRAWVRGAIPGHDHCIREVERAMTAAALERLEPSTPSLVEFPGNGSVRQEADEVMVATP